MYEIPLAKQTEFYHIRVGSVFVCHGDVILLFIIKDVIVIFPRVPEKLFRYVTNELNDP